MELMTTTQPIKVNYDDVERLTVSGRELHKALGVETPYHKWFPRMCEYGFAEGVDFNSDKFVQVQTEGKRAVSREVINHQITIPMAKELCMLQRTEIGKKFRRYFIAIEEKWNSPEAIMGRALLLSKKKIDFLTAKNDEQRIQIEQLEPKATYCDAIIGTKDLMPTTLIAKDYGKSTQWLNNYLCDKKVQHKLSTTYVLNQKYADKGYTGTKTFIYKDYYNNCHSNTSTLWTQKGRQFIYELLKADGIFPMEIA